MLVFSTFLLSQNHLACIIIIVIVIVIITNHSFFHGDIS